LVAVTYLQEQNATADTEDETDHIRTGAALQPDLSKSDISWAASAQTATD